jgi:hypothetical protein
MLQLNEDLSLTWLAARWAAGEHAPELVDPTREALGGIRPDDLAAVRELTGAVLPRLSGPGREAARRVVARSRFLFVPATLEYLRKGGRIGGASALLGSVLQIRPILTVIDGKTEVLRRVRTSERARREIVAQFAADVEEKGLAEVAVHHIEAPELAEEVASAVEEVAGRRVDRVPIGPVIGLHVGPGTVGLVYVSEQEMHKEG